MDRNDDALSFPAAQLLLSHCAPPDHAPWDQGSQRTTSSEVTEPRHQEPRNAQLTHGIARTTSSY
jgi:hypothetical protein